jgi:hypothetical protein
MPVNAWSNYHHSHTKWSTKRAAWLHLIAVYRLPAITTESTRPCPQTFHVYHLKSWYQVIAYFSSSITRITWLCITSTMQYAIFKCRKLNMVPSADGTVYEIINSENLSFKPFGYFLELLLEKPFLVRD